MSPGCWTRPRRRRPGVRIGTDYPAPIVDHAEARARALEVYGAAREVPPPRG